MAYSVPTTRIPGERPSADEWNQDVVQNIIALKAMIDALSAVQPIPLGAWVPYGGTTQPPGYLFCNGQPVSRATYADLFALIGTTFGAGNGSTTFNLPDMRGRNALGRDDMGGLGSANRVTDPQADVLGGSLGAESHLLVIGEIPAHTHTETRMTVGGSPNVLTTGTGAGGPTSTNTGSAGGGAAHNNMSPNLVSNYIIRAL